MTENRIIEYYKGFKVVVAYYKEEYQARGHHKIAETVSARKCDSLEDAQKKIRLLIDSAVELNRESIRQGLIENHKKWMENKGKQYLGVRAITSFRRTSHCYSCKAGVDNAYDVECAACGWIICSNCGACGCGYASVI
jgi:hypothetical protein